MQFTEPTDAERERAFKWCATGAAIIAGAVVALVATVATHETPLRGPWAYVGQSLLAVVAYGIAALLWGLRTHGRQWEFDSVKKTGFTSPYEAMFTVIAILSAAAPIGLGVMTLVEKYR